ncbi:MAG: sn-glycerol-3-phosphate transporter [Idiomarina sp.]|nr:sn-glycerol-3-phosphate transporter [Idiomarina sp.]
MEYACSKQLVTLGMLCGLFALGLAAPASAQSLQLRSVNDNLSPPFRMQLQTSIYTTHFNPKPEHNNHQRLLGVEWYGDYFESAEWQRYSNHLGRAMPLLGGAWFHNSFDQKTIYLYGGVRQDLRQFRNAQLYGKITVGLIHGYRGDYQHKIPFNQIGIAPAAIPMIGLQTDSAHIEMTLFGISGLMFTVGYSF